MREFLGVVAAIVAIIVAPRLAGWWTRPYRCAIVDGPRGFLRLRFQNPGYANALARAWTSPQAHTLAVPNAYVEQLLHEAGAAPGAPRPPRVTPTGSIPVAA